MNYVIAVTVPRILVQITETKFQNLHTIQIEVCCTNEILVMHHRVLTL